MYDYFVLKCTRLTYPVFSSRCCDVVDDVVVVAYYSIFCNVYNLTEL